MTSQEFRLSLLRVSPVFKVHLAHWALKNVFLRFRKTCQELLSSSSAVVTLGGDLEVVAGFVECSGIMKSSGNEASNF